MHAPDGFLTAGTAVASGALSLGAIGAAARQVRQILGANQIPLAGITAAFIFAAQMFNFPVAAGTTGHLLGGALAAILLGPSMGAISVAIVVIVQAIVFADGGLTALGYNILNMAVIPAFGGYAVFTFLRRLMPRSGGGVVAAGGLAAWLSVMMAAIAFSIEWLFGASAPVSFDTVLTAMVGTHLLIGIGEGVISGMAIGVVLSSRPDLVYGARDLDRAQVSDRRPMKVRSFLIAATVTTFLLAGVVSQFAFDDPDGLERVAQDTGISSTQGEAGDSGGLFAEYATQGVRNEPVSLAIAGVSGTLITLFVGWGVLASIRERPGRPRKHASA